MAGLGPCSCSVCAGVDPGPQHAGDGLSGLSGAKPVWGLEQIVDNLTRWDARWAPAPVPYTFYASTPAHLAGHPDWQGFVSFSPEQREAARLVMELIADVANLQFVERPDDGTMPGPMNSRITFSTSLSTEQHFTAYAGTKFAKTFELGDAHRITSAEQMYNGHRWNGSMEPGDRPFHVLIHEILHAVGLPHPGNYDASSKQVIAYGTHAAYAQDSRQFTSMSYFPASATGSTPPGFPQTPLLHDVAALQSLYGANMSTRAGDTVYGYNATANRALYDFSVNLRPTFAIWDAGGVDTLDFSQTNLAVNVDLAPGAFSDAFGGVNNIAIAFGVVVENAVGGMSADVIRGNAAGNHVLAGLGDDRVEGRAGDDVLFGNQGSDTLEGGEGNDTLYGGRDADQVYGGADRDFVQGDYGADLIDGGAGADILSGGHDNDRVFGGDGAEQDLVFGGDGDDTLDGGLGGDFVAGDDGADIITNRGGVDLIFGGAGNDTITAGGDGDCLLGNQDDDRLIGGAGVDTLFGGRGSDTLEGGAGDDWLSGDLGADLLTGGAGRDRFVFTSMDGAVDRITDFDALADLLDLSAIDADASQAGDQAFAVVSGFTGQAGQLLLSYDGTSTTVRGDVNGDGVSDFDLLIGGQVTSADGWLL